MHGDAPRRPSQNGTARRFPSNPRAGAVFVRVNGRAAMFHANTLRLIDYWSAAKAEAPAPTRRAVEPSALAALLPQVFILGRSGPGAFRFRLVGGFVADLHGADLREFAFTGLWRPSARPRIDAALQALVRAPRPLIVSAEIWCEADILDAAAPLGLEIALLPLAPDPSGVERVFGLYQPTSEVAHLRGRDRTIGQAALALSLKSISPADPRGRPALRLVADHGRRLD